MSALGFQILSIRFPNGPFVELCGIVCPEALILATTPRRCNRLPDVIFLDLLSLPSVSRLATTYWRAWEVPHVFYVWGGNSDSGAPGGGGWLAQVAPMPPPGWRVRDIGLSHCRYDDAAMDGGEGSPDPDAASGSSSDKMDERFSHLRNSLALVKGELGLQAAEAPYTTVHGGLQGAYAALAGLKSG